MDSATWIATVAMVVAGITMALGVLGPALAQGKAVSEGLKAIAQQPDEAANLTRTLFVGLAMIESLAIYCLVVSLILVFANPFWTHALAGKV